MTNKDLGRHFAELHNLIHREIISTSNCESFYDNENSPVSHAGSCIIVYLHEHQETDVFQRDLEHEFNVRRSTMSKVLSLLEQKGYITRASVDSDRRLKRIVLTKKSCAMADKLKESKTRLEDKMVSGLSKEELTALKNTLEKIKQNLRQEEYS